MKTITISTLRKSLKAHFDYVSNSSEVVIVRRKNVDDAVVLISIRDYNSIKETEHLFSTEANTVRLRATINQMKQGETIPFI